MDSTVSLHLINLGLPVRPLAQWWQIYSAATVSFWSDIDKNAPQVWRLQDRVLIGAAAYYTTTRLTNSFGAWITGPLDGANWAIRDAQLGVMHTRGGLAVVGMSRSKDGDALSSQPASAGLAGYVIADSANNKAGWAGYFDVQFESGSAGYGVEIAVKNKGANVNATPDFAVAGTVGVWLDTGDDSYGGAHANPNNTAIQIGAGPNGNTWNKGIVIFNNALTVDAFNHTRAISLPKLSQITWYDGNNNEAFILGSHVTTPGAGLQMLAFDNQLQFFDTGGLTFATLKNKTNGVGTFNMKLPTSSAGLVSGDWWSNNGIVTIVP